MKELTKAEEQMMMALWNIEKGYISDIIAALPEPKPAYTTVSTIIKILEKKGFISHKTHGKNHEYYPLIDKATYSEKFIKKFAMNYFDNSFTGLVSCFANEQNLSIIELEEIKQIIENEIDKKKNQ